MTRPCDHTAVEPDCRVCELWSEYPEYHALYEGMEQPAVPELVRSARAQGLNALWRDPGLVARMQMQSRKAPGLLRRAASLAKAAAAHAATGFARADDAAVAKRLALCMACEDREPSNDTCRRCGCYVRVKAAWASSSCPAGRW